MLKQGHLTNEMSPTKSVKRYDKTPNKKHGEPVLSTPAHTSHGSNVPQLNWDLSMITDVQNQEELHEGGNFVDSVQKSRRKPVPIKSKYMQSAASRKTPAANKTLGKTPSTSNRSNRQQIDELNREDTFTFENKAQPTPKSSVKSTARHPNGSERKASQAIRGTSRDTLGCTKFARSVVQNPKDLFSCSLEKSKDACQQISPGHVTVTQPSQPVQNRDVTEVDLNVLECQKLQMLYLLQELENTQDTLSIEASSQLYQMWKVQEHLRTEGAVLEKEVVIKEYLCEVNEMCIQLLPICSELTSMMPKFDAQYLSLVGMLDNTRHYMNTVQIAKVTGNQVEELQDAMKQVVEVLQSINYETAEDKENLSVSAIELQHLKVAFEKSIEHYDNAAKLVEKINSTNNENLFLTSTLPKLNINTDSEQ